MDLQNRTDLELHIESHEGSKLRPILADLNLQNDMVDDTVAHCQKIITEDPGSPYGYYLIALAEIRSGEIADAIEHLKQTMDLDNGFLDAYYLLMEIGKDKLSPGVMKACYEKIVELNPYDDNARTEAGRISEDADRDSLKDIHLPEIKVLKTTSRVAAQEKPAELKPEKKAEPEIIPEPEPEIFSEITPEPVNETPAQVGLSEEEAHLGPMILESEEEPQLDEPVLETQEPIPEPEPASAQVTVPPPAPTIPKESVPAPPSPTNVGSSPSALNDMFAKLKTKPLEELQKESWSLPVVEAPAPEKNPNDLAKKPDIKFTVPLKEKVDPKKKLEEIHMELGLKPQPGPIVADEKKKETEKTALTPIEEKPKKTNSPKKANSNSKGKDTGNTKVEIKIPVPTFTLVEVFKKQKLYDEALQLLDVLEKKSKNPERIEKERAMIIQLKMEE